MHSSLVSGLVADCFCYSCDLEGMVIHKMITDGRSKQSTEDVKGMSPCLSCCLLSKLVLGLASARFPDV